MKPSQPATVPVPPKRVVRKTFAVFAMLGVGVLAGAMLGELSVMSFSFASPSSLRLRHSGIASEVNGYLPSTDSLGQSRHAVAQPRGPVAHHVGI